MLQAIASGFPDTIDTYGLISGLWTSTFALGAFIGPTIAGILFDSVGFPWGTLFILGIHILVIILLVGFSLSCKKPELPEVQITEDEPKNRQKLIEMFGLLAKLTISAAKSDKVGS